VRFLLDEWRKLRPYFSLLDFGAPPSTRVGWIIRVAVVTFAAVLLYRRVGVVTSPLLATKPTIPLPAEEIEDYRFRLPERTRQEIFSEIAGSEQAERRRAIESNSWHGHLWSREDDRGHFERMQLRQIAQRWKISLSQVYLILDEGIRSHWPGPDGQPLPGTTPPLNPRTTW